MTQSRAWRYVRLTWAAMTVIILETLLLGLALTPAVAFTRGVLLYPMRPTAQVAVIALAAVPLYLLFSTLLVVTSALATRLLGWRTPAGVSLRLADFEWPILDWGRYLMTIHVVRVFAGAAFRSTPIWSWYLRLNGAQVGRLVWVNSLAVMDHNLLRFDDEVVIGSDAHIAGHIVERGVLTTAPVHLARGTVIGVGSVVGIGVTTGEATQVGPLSVVPKFSTLDGGTSYGGVPVHRLH